MPEPREPASVDLIWLLEMSHEQYVERFRGTAIRRAKHWMLQRNAAVALGNVGGLDSLPHLDRAMRENVHPVVRGHAAWAIGRIGQRLRAVETTALLSSARQREGDATVKEEIDFALDLVRKLDA